ncbi:IS200/IS605 family transposase [Vibrio coralliirubri]|uniref:IS200/IS605 family transposase n=1 Tax=Vibrio coralliirubri TaxID=1516159 RepID=UPI0030B95925
MLFRLVLQINKFMRSHFHCVYKLKYHLVLVTKYRNKCFTGEILNRLEAIFREQCSKWDVELLQFGGEGDHVHLMLGMHPNIEPAKLINSLKTVSSRLIRKEYAEHMAKYYWKPTLWSRAYCLITAGGAPLEVLEEYIKNQDRPT